MPYLELCSIINLLPHHQCFKFLSTNTEVLSKGNSSSWRSLVKFLERKPTVNASSFLLTIHSITSYNLVPSKFQLLISPPTSLLTLLCWRIPELSYPMACFSGLSTFSSQYLSRPFSLSVPIILVFPLFRVNHFLVHASSSITMCSKWP